MGEHFGIDDYQNQTFYAPLVKPSSQVLDPGSCLGDFAQYMVVEYEAYAYAVEPAPALFAELPSDPKILKYNVAIGGHDGTATFYLSSKIQAGNVHKEKPNTTGTVTVTMRCLDSFLSDIGASDVALLIVDIEGAEVEMFERASAEAI